MTPARVGWSALLGDRSSSSCAVPIVRRRRRSVRQVGGECCSESSPPTASTSGGPHGSPRPAHIEPVAAPVQSLRLFLSSSFFSTQRRVKPPVPTTTNTSFLHPTTARTGRLERRVRGLRATPVYRFCLLKPWICSSKTGICNWTATRFTPAPRGDTRQRRRRGRAKTGVDHACG